MRKITLFVALLWSTGFLLGQNGLDFDGVDDYISTTYPGISGSQSRTVEAWIKTTSNTIPGGGGVQRVILDWGATSNGARFTLNLLWANSIRLEVAGNGISGTQAVNDGLWHHVAAVYNSAVSTNQVKLYIDGQLHVQGNLTVPVNSGTATPLQIGRRIDGANPFQGGIDEVRVWSVARTDAQILANYNKQLCGPQTGLEVYYRFDQGTANGNNLTLNTMPSHVNNYLATLQNFNLYGTYSNWVLGASISGNSTGSSTLVQCKSYTAPNGTVYTQSGNYSYTLTNAIGCDSIVNLSLTIDTVDVRVTQSGALLTAMSGTGSYQWIDCATNTPVAGAVSQVFSPANNGSYAVVVHSGNCIDTSNCYTVSGIGLAENLQNRISLVPNPSAGSAKLFLPDGGHWSVVVSDANGRILAAQSANQNTCELPKLERGLYLVTVTNGIGSGSIRWVCW